jgi:Mg2+/citrate symporter
MFGWIKRTALWAIGIVALILTAWMAGKREQSQKQALQNAKSYAKTRKEIDSVEDNITDDPAVLREWLRDRGKQ